MKKNSAKFKNATKRKTPAVATKPPKLTRREFMNRVQIWGLIALAGSGITYWVVDDVRASIGEHDLSRIGNGIPAVVQIHDPNCSVCAALMREAREALEALEEDELQYLVANIRHENGRRLANRYGVAHVTLLLFDGTGKMREVLTGQNDSDTLEDVFRRHLKSTQQHS